MGTHIQAVLFDKSIYTTTQARAWLKKEGIQPLKRVDNTEKYHRYRIIEPNYKKYNYRIKRSRKGIDFIIAFDK